MPDTIPVEAHHTERWLRTSKGDLRGYIQPVRLEELWFHTGTNCNLRCPFCLEGSVPGNNRLEFMLAEEARRFMDEAMTLGVERFSFTGGEPFVNPHLLEILNEALERRPCLVLTNGTEPLLNRIGKIKLLLTKPHPLSFRISLDFPDAVTHDESRGRGNFQKSIRCLKELHRLGFGISIARLMRANEDKDAVEAAYRKLFVSHDLPENLRIVAFPDFLPPDSERHGPEITESCMRTYLTAEQREAFMCSYSKMIVKQDGRCGIYACTLVDDDAAYNLGSTLAESMTRAIRLGHQRCFSCFAYGASCSESH